MSRSQEQLDADAALRQAVDRVCAANGWATGATLDEYVVTGVLIEDHLTNERAHTRYFTLLADDAMPEHHVVGLLQQSLHFYHQLSSNTEVG